jgi:hypothetical protein
MNPLVPVIEEFARSVAVMVRLPPLRRVARKTPKPLLSVALAGSIALPSVLLKWTVPL